MSRPPLVTDELPDRIWGRPAARALLPLLLRTPLTANQVTGLATLAGLAGGAFLGLGQGVPFAVATAIYLALDCADGMVARSGRGGGVLGRLIDGVGDYFVALAVHAGWIVWIAGSRGWGEAVAWGGAAGVSLAWTSFLLDRYKRRYRGDVDDMAEVRRAVAASRGPWRWLLSAFLPYAARVAGDVRIPDRPAYQARVRFPMALFLQAGPTWHFAAMAACAVAGEPLLYCQMAVFPFNAVALLALVLQAQLERRPPAVVLHDGAVAAP